MDIYLSPNGYELAVLINSDINCQTQHCDQRNQSESVPFPGFLLGWGCAQAMRSAGQPQAAPIGQVPARGDSFTHPAGSARLFLGLPTRWVSSEHPTYHPACLSFTAVTRYAAHPVQLLITSCRNLPGKAGSANLLASYSQPGRRQVLNHGDFVRNTPCFKVLGWALVTPWNKQDPSRWDGKQAHPWKENWQIVAVKPGAMIHPALWQESEEAGRQPLCLDWQDLSLLLKRTTPNRSLEAGWIAMPWIGLAHSKRCPCVALNKCWDVQLSSNTVSAFSFVSVCQLFFQDEQPSSQIKSKDFFLWPLKSLQCSCLSHNLLSTHGNCTFPTHLSGSV